MASIYTDSLRLTPDGEQAIADANSGGMVIQPARYRCGDYEGQAPSTVPNTLLGHELAKGNLSYCQAITENTARFIFDVELQYRQGDGMKRIGEVLIELEDGRVFGHVVLAQPIIAVPNSVTRISLLVHVQTDLDKLLAVKLYDYATVPSVAKVENLPSAEDNYFNAISVLNLHTNTDGTTSAGMAYRFGKGGYEWGFSEHDRVYGQKAGSAFINENTLDLDLGIKPEEVVIIQTVAGTGAGHVRKFKKEHTVLVNQGDPIPFFNAETVIAIWRRITNPLQDSNGIPYPENNDVPETWVLARGKEKPVWTPQSGNGGKANATLFIPPSRLNIHSVVTTAQPDSLTYPLSDDVESSVNVLLAVSGVLQPRSAYSTQGDELQLSGSVPTAMTLDVREFRHEPTQGHVINWEVIEAFGDGQNSTFNLGRAVQQPDHCFFIVGNVWQPTTSFKLDGGTKLISTEPPPSGRKVTIYVARYEERPNWSTRLQVAEFRHAFAQDRFPLPVIPESKAHVIINAGGLAQHSQDWTLVGQDIILNRPVDPFTMVEATVFENCMAIGTQDNDIKGVLTSVTPSPTGILVHRQGMPPLDVPVPQMHVTAGKGIRVEGQGNDLKIVNVDAENASADPKAVFNIQQRVEDSEEITVRQRIEIKKGVLVTASADFSVILGPGFAPSTMREHVQYVIGYSTPASPEAEYGRGLKGTGSAGFTYIAQGDSGAMAYANVSGTQMYDLVKENHPQGFVEIVAKIRISDANISSYGAELIANLCIKVEPK